MATTTCSLESRNSSEVAGVYAVTATLSFGTCIYKHKCMSLFFFCCCCGFFFLMHVCSNAVACVCKTVQTPVFPGQLVNHIWGKNLDSFPPSFSAAFPSPTLRPPPPLFSSKKKKKAEASFVYFFLSCVLRPTSACF